MKAPTRPKPKMATEAALEVPADMAGALKKNSKARRAFENFSWSKRRGYIEWLIEAKREQTRTRRLATALEWMAEGKSLNWRYQPK